jgi:hypothetical protein
MWQTALPRMPLLAAPATSARLMICLSGRFVPVQSGFYLLFLQAALDVA